MLRRCLFLLCSGTTPPQPVLLLLPLDTRGVPCFRNPSGLTAIDASCKVVAEHDYLDQLKEVGLKQLDPSSAPSCLSDSVRQALLKRITGSWMVYHIPFPQQTVFTKLRLHG